MSTEMRQPNRYHVDRSVAGAGVDDVNYDDPLSNQSAERMVIASLIQHGSNFLCEFEGKLTSNSFTDPFYQTVFKILEASLDPSKPYQKIDYPTFLSTAESLGLAVTIHNDRVDTQRLFKTTPIRYENAVAVAKKVKKLEITRQYREMVVGVCKDLNNVTGDEPIQSILSLGEEPVLNFSQRFIMEADDKIDNLGEMAKPFFEYLAENPRQLMGLSTGYPLMDRVMGGGLRSPSLTIVAARSGKGKSFFGENVCLHAIKELKVPTLYLDTELTEETQLARIMANWSGFEIDYLESGEFGKNAQHRERIYKLAEDFQQFPLHYKNVSGRGFEEVSAFIRRWVKQVVGTDENGNTKPCLVCFDYLKTLRNDAQIKEYELLGQFAGSLHDTAVALKIPILTFVQLNREGINSEESNVLSGSDRQLWFASTVLLWRERSPEEITTDGCPEAQFKLFCLKSRYGRGHAQGEYIAFKFDKPIGRITEIKSSNELRKEKGGFEFDGEPPKFAA